ncbi:hypothetical protein [Pengzhenrongella sicca]|uniref:Transporter n=1 Tax=Pengzhenrongella sicca TaxID=2819238 RepID=A0A8A4ZD77_9MICO|nr:hypothetical protein [Pengzhenrongella sicca]QTE28843.1 hypothetical protein J4E96_16140 [Pengzhenrongella sicca]
MVAHLVRLKLTLLRNGLRRSVWQVVGLVIAAVYALGAVVVAIVGLAMLANADLPLIRTVLVLLGSLLVLGWWVVPLVAYGVDATLDPARFVTFGIRRRDLLAGLAISGLVGVPGAATAVVVLGTSLAWWRHPLAALVALPCAVVAIATCLVGARATTTALSRFVGRRRYRELLTIVIFIPLMLLGPLGSALAEGLGRGSDALPGLAEAIGWTPIGAVWAVPADVAAGAWAGAGLKLLVALGTLAALVVGWDRALSQALVTPSSAGRTRRSTRGRGLGAFAWLPGTPTGAVAARCLTYWLRDPRYAAAIVIVPLIPVLLYFGSGGTAGGGLLLAGPIAGFMLGWTVSADVAYDGTAFWTHVAAPISGRVDRAGRALATAVIGVPVTLVFVVGTVAVTGRWETLPALLGASLGLLLTALGGASIVSARVVYPVPKPGDSPFSTQQGASMAAFVSQLVGWLAITVVSLPELVLAGFSVATGSVPLGVLALVVGTVWGTAALAGGVRLGGRTLEGRAPELLARLVAFG